MKQLMSMIQRLFSPYRWAVGHMVSEDPGSRVAAASVLARLGPQRIEQAVSTLIPATGSNKEFRYDLAGDTFAKIGISAIPALEQALRGDDLDLRRVAVRALGRIGVASEDAVAALIRAADKEWGCHDLAGDALAEIGTEAIPSLTMELGSEVDWRRRVFALETVGKMGPCAKGLVPVLIRILHENPREGSEHVLSQTAESLGRIGVDSQEVVEALIHLLLRWSDTHAGSAAAVSAANVLDQFGWVPSNVEMRVAHILASEGQQWISQAQWARVETIGIPAVPVLMDFASKAGYVENKPFEKTIERMLEKGRAEARNVIPTLYHVIEVISDHIDDLKTFAVRLLVRLGEPKGSILAKVLCAYYTSSASPYKQIDVLGDLGPEVVPELVRQLRAERDPDSLRHDVAYALGRVGAGAVQAVPSLMGIIELARKEGNRDIRDGTLWRGVGGDDARWAARVLGMIGPRAKDAVPLLIWMLQEGGWSDRAAAATALGGIGPEARSAVPILERLVDDVRFSDGSTYSYDVKGILKKIRGA